MSALEVAGRSLRVRYRGGTEEDVLVADNELVATGGLADMVPVGGAAAGAAEAAGRVGGEMVGAGPRHQEEVVAGLSFPGGATEAEQGEGAAVGEVCEVADVVVAGDVLVPEAAARVGRAQGNDLQWVGGG